MSSLFIQYLRIKKFIYRISIKEIGRSFLLMIAGILGSLMSYGQSYITHVQEYGVEQGLSHRSVQCIAQDKKGFIWIGTEQGLNRFDGYTFQHWTKADNGLQYDYVSDIFVAPDGLIWLFYWSGIGENGFIKGIDILDPETGGVQPMEKRIAAKLPIARLRLAIGFAYDNEGTLYIGTQSPAGVVAYHPQRGFTYTDLGRAGILYLQFCDGQQNLWGTYFEHGQNSYEAAQIGFNLITKQILMPFSCTQYLPFYNRHHTFRRDFGYSLGREGNYPLFWYDPQSSAAVSPELGTGHSRFVAYLDTAKTLLVRDLELWDTRRNEVVLDLDAAFSMTNKEKEYPQAWYIDRAGRLWIGTSFGLGVVEVHPNRFYRLLYSDENQGNTISVRGILPVGKELFVNTEKYGQYQIDRSTNAARQLPHVPQGVYLYGLGKDPTGNVYFTTNVGISLAQLTPQGVFREWKWWGGAAAWSIFFVDKNRFWAGTMPENGLHAGDMSRPDIRDSVALNGFPELRKVAIYHIAPTADGSIWICAESGLYQADAKRGILHRYWSGGKGAYYLPADYFLHFYEDAQGIFWLSTSGSGLIRWDRKAGKHTRYGRKAGLPAETVYAAYEDSHAHLWLPSDYGIIQFDKQKQEVRHIYSTGEGVTHQEFNRISHARAADGTLYFGGMNGITAFKPDEFYANRNAATAPLAMVECTKFNSKTGEMTSVIDEIRRQNQLELQPNEGYFVLELALLSFMNTKQIQYAYRLDDETVWNYQTDRQLRIGGLSTGTHTLHIKGQAANGEWGANEITLTVVQLAPIYLRWWFLLLAAVAAIAGIILFVRQRTRQLLRRQREVEAEIKAAIAQIAQQAAELKHLDTLKSRFFANVSHELRTPLTLMLGPLATNVKHQLKNASAMLNTETAYGNAKQLLQLVNELLDLSKLEVGKMDVREVAASLQPLLFRIINGFEGHAQRLTIELIFDYRASERLWIRVDVDKLTKILNNLLSNALKFTPAGGRVRVQVETAAQVVQIIVSDTGRGIHPDDMPYIFDRFYQTKRREVPVEGGTGIGLALSQELAQVLGGEIRVESTVGKGSTFFFSFPYVEAVADEIDAQESALPAADSLAPVETPSAIAAEIAQPLAVVSISAPILVVEDNPSLRGYIQQLLGEWYPIHAVAHGKAALDWLQAAPTLPALIISDVMMPVMDGFELLEVLKNTDAYRRIPVVMLTARADMQDKLHALRIGVDDYLLKPFEEEELLARIANLLRNYAARSAALAETDTASPTLRATTPTESDEQVWLSVFEALVQSRLSESKLTADELAEAMGMSRSVFFKQVKRLTGLTPAQYVDEARFHRARVLLETQQVQAVKAAAYSVGFLQVEHFSRSFQQRFGKYPSEYLG